MVLRTALLLALGVRRAASHAHQGSMKITLSTTPRETPSAVTITGKFTCKPLSL